MNADANGNPDFDNPEPPAPGLGHRFIVKDSGARAAYPSGMVRDSQEGKPRFDLLWPPGISYEDQFLTRLAQHMTLGAEKYGEHNWVLADSLTEVKRFRGSGLRHHYQYLAGETDEDHAAAAVFNIMAAEMIQRKIDRAAQETADILADPATMEAIREGQESFDFKHERDLHAEEWAQNLADPETMGDLRAKGWAQNLADKREWPSVISVQYTPTGPDDPWQAMMWSEETNGLLSFDELKQVVVMQLGMGHPDGVHLKVKGVPWFVDGHALVAEVVGLGQSLELVRKPTILAGDFPVYDPNAIGHYAFPVEPLRAIPADEVPSANRDRTQL